jgi:uncharacterized protein (TIGR02145 family)
MKSTTGWKNNKNGNNSSGYNALPGGARYWSGDFGNIGELIYWWASTESGGIFAVYSCLDDFGVFGIGIFHQRSGYYVRCIKD